MSKVAISGNASGTGTFTIAAPNSNSDRTITLPDEAGTVLTSGGAIDVNASAPADSLAISSTGNVGIGSTSPAGYSGYKTLTLNSTSGGIVEMQASGSVVGNFISDNSQMTLSTVSSYPIVFKTALTERMRIDSGGNLLVGTTSEQRPTLSRTPRITAYNTAAEGLNTVTSDNSYAGWAHTSLDGGTGTHYIAYFENVVGTEVGKITHNGTNTTYSTSSDYRLKENIAPMTGALAAVAQLNPVTYTWKATGEQGQGFIAHELQAVVPDAVVGEKDAVNEDGSIKPQGIDTSFLVATLTAAIKELKAELDAAKERIDALEGTV